MSVYVSTEVWRHASAHHCSFIVLLALADQAHDDGVTWISEERLAEKARLSVRSVRDHLRELEATGHIEIRQAQRSRRRVKVIRVVVGAIRGTEIVYGDLPFKLSEPFSDDRQIPVRSENDDRQISVDDDRQISGPTRGRDSLLEPSEREPVEIPSESLVEQGEREVSVEIRAAKGPKLTKVNGRDIAFDALQQATGAGSGEERRVAVALNGRAKQAGIRAFHAIEHPPPAKSDFETNDDWIAAAVRWEESLAAEVERRAKVYAEVMPPGSMLTPTALCSWWGRLAQQQRVRGRGITEADWDVMPDAIEQAKDLFGV